MTVARRRLARLLPWLAVAAAGALVGAAVQLLPVDRDAPGVTLVAAAPAPSDRAPSTGATAATEAAVGPTEGDSSSPPLASVPRVPRPERDLDTAGAAVPAPDSAPAPSVADASSTRLRVPALYIDATIVTLGLDAGGQLQTPSDGVSVGWYDISATPGQVGNALLGGHFDWAGSLAVFAGLNRLEPGDLVYIDDPQDGELVYQVTTAGSVPWDAQLVDILRTDAAGSSLTLFTCGGTFDQDRGEYDQRVVVRAVQVDASEPLAARR